MRFDLGKTVLILFEPKKAFCYKIEAEIVLCMLCLDSFICSECLARNGEFHPAASVCYICIGVEQMNKKMILILLFSRSKPILLFHFFILSFLRLICYLVLNIFSFLAYCYCYCYCYWFLVFYFKQFKQDYNHFNKTGHNNKFLKRTAPKSNTPKNIYFKTYTIISTKKIVFESIRGGLVS